MAAGVRYVQAPDAARVLEETCRPALRPAANAIADAYRANVPVHHGVAIRLTRTSVREGSEAGHPAAYAEIDSPFWHFLEYGTAFNPAYRPAQNAVQGLGMRYTPE